MTVDGVELDPAALAVTEGIIEQMNAIRAADTEEILVAEKIIQLMNLVAHTARRQALDEASQVHTPPYSYDAELEELTVNSREVVLDKTIDAEKSIILDMLQDPNMVHLCMLRGVIAKPSPAQAVHIYRPEHLIPHLLYQTLPDIDSMIEVIRLDKVKRYNDCSDRKEDPNCYNAAYQNIDGVAKWGVEGCCFYDEAKADIEAIRPILAGMSDGIRHGAIIKPDFEQLFLLYPQQIVAEFLAELEVGCGLTIIEDLAQSLAKEDGYDTSCTIHGLADDLMEPYRMAAEFIYRDVVAPIIAKLTSREKSALQSRDQYQRERDTALVELKLVKNEDFGI